MLSYLIDRYFIKQPKLRAFVTRILYGSADRRISLLGTDLTVNSIFENGYVRAAQGVRHKALFRDEAAVLINLATLVQPDTTFLDIGANIGIYSSIIARLSRLKQNVRVIAFEVDPVTYERLAINAAANGFEARNLGISDRTEDAEFIRGAVSHITTMIQHKNAWSIDGLTFRTKCVPLAALDIPGSSIILKIDVEGHEWEVLKGAIPLFDANRVAAVYLDGFSRHEEVMSFLQDRGFSFYDGRTLQPAAADVFSLLAIKKV